MILKMLTLVSIFSFKKNIFTYINFNVNICITTYESAVDYLNIIYTKSYDQTKKKLKKYVNESNNLNRIIDLIEVHSNFDMLIHNPLIKMYRFERLKYEYNDYYSFNNQKLVA